jgi:hypothetical protein
MKTNIEWAHKVLDAASEALENTNYLPEEKAAEVVAEIRKELLRDAINLMGKPCSFKVISHVYYKEYFTKLLATITDGKPVVEKETGIVLRDGDIIRYKYLGEWEYAIWHPDHSRTVFASQSSLEQWRSGTKIVVYGADPEYAKGAIALRQKLVDGCEVISCVCKGNKFLPRKRAKS